MVASVLLSIILIFLKMIGVIGQKRIMGGYGIDVSDAPYMASLRLKYVEAEFGGMGIFCLGTILKNRVILTVAHCLYNSTPEIAVAVLGTSYSYGIHPDMQVLDIAAWRQHGLFVMGYAEYDIALVFTDADINRVKGIIEYAPLNTKEVSTSTRCRLSSWGRVDFESDKNHHRMQAIWTTVIGRRDCFYMVKQIGLMCSQTGTLAAPSIGDSGAPLVCHGKVAGLMMASPTPNPKGLSYYTDVHLFRKWINGCIYTYLNGAKPLRFITRPCHLVLAISIWVTLIN